PAGGCGGPGAGPGPTPPPSRPAGRPPPTGSTRPRLRRRAPPTSGPHASPAPSLNGESTLGSLLASVDDDLSAVLRCPRSGLDRLQTGGDQRRPGLVDRQRSHHRVPVVLSIQDGSPPGRLRPWPSRH